MRAAARQTLFERSKVIYNRRRRRLALGGRSAAEGAACPVGPAHCGRPPFEKLAMHDETPAHVARQEAIWEDFQNEGQDWFAGSRDRLRFLARQLRGRARVLNIGVGDGTLEELAQAGGARVFALDPSERAIVALRARLGLGDRAQVGYAQAMPFGDGAFDAVVASEVFEHLTPDVLRMALFEVHRVLAPGGMLLGTVPARERLADQTIVCPCCAAKFHRWGHQQSFTCESLREILSTSLRVESVREHYFAPWSVLNWKGKCACGLKALLSRVGIHGSEENIVFRAHKAD